MKKSIAVSALVAAAALSLLAFRSKNVRSSDTSGIPSSAMKDIHAGNDAWIRGMTTLDAKIIAESYCEDGVDVTPHESIVGRAALERYFAERMKSRGAAKNAEVHSEGVRKPGKMIYEWGWAAATWGDGAPEIRGRYLTVWRQDPDSHWRIYRNVIVD